ncbi:hypothetical protein V7O62_12355 [Methanolobus sp. ZRKC2]|uniref:hypothetical protein n=1 Tax=Methanolobus sp. ZRKC2 TaxID=3125783 RepID=UPI00324D3C61
MIDTKNILMIFILIACLLFSGCVSSEDEGISEASFSSETDSESYPAPDLIIKPSDVPGLTLDDYFFYAAPKSDIYTYNSSRGSKYTDALPLVTRNVGEKSYWIDKSGRAVSVEIEKFDSDEGLEFMFKRGYEWIEIFKTAMEEQDVQLQGAEYDTDTCNIGTNGFYSCSSPSEESDISYANLSDISHTDLIFMTSNNELVTVNVMDEKGKDLDEAIRIAKIIEDRL